VLPFVSHAAKPLAAWLTNGSTVDARATVEPPRPLSVLVLRLFPVRPQQLGHVDRVA